MRRKWVALYIFIVFLTLVLIEQVSLNASDFHLSTYYIKNAFKDTGAVNVVTSIYLNYRYYDTLFEALMLLFSIIGVVYLSIHEGDELDE